MNVLDPVTALAVLVAWIAISCVLGCVIGHIIRLGTGTDHLRPYDRERDR